MIRSILTKLRPTDKQLRRLKPSPLLRLRLWFYTASVSFMAKAYSRCAVHDILLTADGMCIEIEERDTDFEHDMQLAHIASNSHWRHVAISRDMTLNDPRRPQWLSHCFKWQRSVRITSPNGHSLIIDHTQQTTLSGNMATTAEVAGNDDGLKSIRLQFATQKRRTRASSVVDEATSQPEVTRTTPQRRRRRVPPPTKVPDSIITSGPPQPTAQPPVSQRVKRTPPTGAVDMQDLSASLTSTDNDQPLTPTPPVARPKPQLKKMRGFDMDDSF